MRDVGVVVVGLIVVLGFRRRWMTRGRKEKRGKRVGGDNMRTLFGGIADAHSLGG